MESPKNQSFLNICSQCHENLAITNVEETSEKVSMKWMFLLVETIPMVCKKCCFFICDNCRFDNQNKCGNECTEGLVDYISAVSPDI